MSNNPLRYTDPTGHMQADDEIGTEGCSDPKSCVHNKPEVGGNNKKKDNNGDSKLCSWLPKACQGGRKNPLTYDTVGVQFEWDLKFFGGIEVKPFFLMNGDDLRNWDWENLEAAGGLAYEVTVGLSAQDAWGVTVMGSDGSVLDQGYLQPPSANAGVCLHACVKASGSYSFAEKQLTSISYTGGGGEGVDFSIGQPKNSIYVYGDNNQGWMRIPFFPQQFPLNFKSPVP